jgi:hypothetical protein
MATRKTIDPLAMWRRQVGDDQCSYETAKRDHHQALRTFSVMKAGDKEMKAEACARLVAAGRTKTDAPKLLHEDEGYTRFQDELVRMADVVGDAELDLSIARNRLNTSRLLLLSHLPGSLLGVLGDSHNAVTE